MSQGKVEAEIHNVHAFPCGPISDLDFLGFLACVISFVEGEPSCHAYAIDFFECH